SAHTCAMPAERAVAPQPSAAETASHVGWSNPAIAPEPVLARETSWPSTSPMPTPTATGATRPWAPAMRSAKAARHKPKPTGPPRKRRGRQRGYELAEMAAPRGRKHHAEHVGEEGKQQPRQERGGKAIQERDGDGPFRVVQHQDSLVRCGMAGSKPP